MQIYRKCLTLLLECILFVVLLILAGCEFPGTNTSSVNTVSAASSSPIVLHPTVITNPTVGTNKAGVGPIVIESPTPVIGGSASSQQVGLTDRMLVINDVSRQVNITTGMTAVTIKITIKNRTGKSIKNLATDYQLVGAEGDMFGLPPDTTSSFFGTIASGSMRSGTIVFQQIPTAAVKKLQLLFRPESAQVVFVPLNA